MTPELEQRRAKDESPFDGEIVVFEDIGLERLREVLAFTFARLEPLYPRVLVFDDWHEHDGYVVTARPGDWKALFEAITSTRSLFGSRNEDWGVRIAVLPPSFEWLLRYHIDDGDTGQEASAACTFDLACTPRASIAGLVQETHARWPESSEVLSATAHFESSYGG